MDKTSRLTGVRLDAGRLDYEMGRRGLRQYQLAALAEISQTQMSHYRHGMPISPDNLRRLAKALLETPPVQGAELVLAVPTGAGDG